MSLLRKKTQLEDEYSLLSEMEMLQVYGGEGVIITNSLNCTVNTVAGCGAPSGGGSNSGGSSSGSSSSTGSSSNGSSSNGSSGDSGCSCSHSDNDSDPNNGTICVGGDLVCV